NSYLVNHYRGCEEGQRHPEADISKRLLQPIEGRLPHQTFTTEKPLRFDRMSGLNAEQLDELEECVDELLEEPWDKGKGRPRELAFREALIVACGYARNNITEEIWAEIFDVGQSTISRYITFLTPLIDQATAGFRPSAAEAGEAPRGAITLGDR